MKPCRQCYEEETEHEDGFCSDSCRIQYEFELMAEEAEEDEGGEA